MSLSINNSTIVIRSAGERTQNLCHNLILAQGVHPENIVTVREAPFSAAMRKSFEIGIERGQPWVFCVDADVLLRPGSIQKMLEFAVQQPEHVCEIQGFVLCKYFGGPRPAGNHLYRTSLLDRVIANIPAEAVDIRPEYNTLEAMKGQGFPWANVPYLVGLHDFEQYHRDIFRKCFVQAHKHQHFTDLFLSIWRKGATADADYRAALAGFARGIEHAGQVFIDSRDELFDVNLNFIGLEEKGSIRLSTWNLDQVETIIRNWREPEIYLKKFPDRLGLDAGSKVLHNSNSTQSVRALLQQKYNDLGLVSSIPYSVGWGLEQLGRLLQKWASKN